jgi:predicted nucleic acid-binding protein
VIVTPCGMRALVVRIVGCLSQSHERGPHDQTITATARATGPVLVTTDQKPRFNELPGVTARVLS